MLSLSLQMEDNFIYQNIKYDINWISPRLEKQFSWTYSLPNKIHLHDNCKIRYMSVIPKSLYQYMYIHFGDTPPPHKHNIVMKMQQ